MSLFSALGIVNIRTKAEMTISALGAKASSDMVLYGETAIYNDLHVIYDLYQLSLWMDRVEKSDEDVQALNSYLLHKISGYVIKNKVGVYGSVIEQPVGDVVVGTIGYLTLFIQFVVGQTVNNYTNELYMSNDDLDFVDSRLIGRSIEVYVDGLQLATDLPDRLSYSFDPLIGQITFSGALYNPSVVRIYTYGDYAVPIDEYLFTEDDQLVIPEV